ncbi:MAG: hypothetical protein OES09_12190 [Gammaproteobacteria bacterium]|nr:hypothetical protein [Gammaproteobacteria bacterium]
MIRTILVLVVPILLGFPVEGSPQQGGTPPDQRNGRLKSVNTLIEKSSAAGQIRASGNEQAKAGHEQAREIYRKAVAAHDAGDHAAADELLKQAATAMFGAVRMAEQKSVVGAKQEQDFQNRLDSVNALMEAHARVSTEKGASAAHEKLRTLVDDRITAARKLRSAGDVVKARGILDEAYVAAKTAIEELRGGDTLVRSLDFASAQEEYEYEIDRNDTHKMLVEVLLKEKMEASAGVKKMVTQYMDKAAQTRGEAEKQAVQGDFESAVRTLEQSTKEIVRAIRSAGIYIPG